MRRVAVIGAGVAGLRAAGLLASAGLDVVVFDKARGAAGRIATRRLDWGRFDHGAQYFTARSSSLAAQVAEWIAQGVVAPWLGRIVALDRGVTRVESDPPTRYVGLPGMSGIARALASGLVLETAVRVAALRPDGAGWRMEADDGGDLGRFDAVVSAVPAPQAVALLAGSRRLAALAALTAYRACHALMVAFSEPVPVDFDAAFVSHPTLGWVAREASKPGRAASTGWVLHSTPAWSEAQLELPAERVAERLIEAFAEAIGRPVPRTTEVAVHRWLYARVERRETVSQPWDAEAKLGVCGDWTLGDRIEDAFISADHLVAAMTESLPDRSPA